VRRARRNGIHWYGLLALSVFPACGSEAPAVDPGGNAGTGGNAAGAGGTSGGSAGSSAGAGGASGGGGGRGAPPAGASGATAGSAGTATSSGGAGAMAGGSGSGAGGTTPGSGGVAGTAGMPAGAGGTDSSGTGGAAAGSAGTAGAAGTAPEGPPAAPEGVIPNDEYPEDMVGIPKDEWESGLVSPTLESEHHNQPSVINGYLQLTGNARFSIYDISDPSAPEQLSVRTSPKDCPQCGEAEGHQVSFAKYGDKFYSVTIHGKGVDIWDITDVRNPVNVKSIDIQGINFGDFTEAVWGVFWQGQYIYVGGTNTGVHVIDANEPADAALVGRLANVGGVNAGPLFPMGNLLVVTTPKDNAGIATVDISNPTMPLILDSVAPAEKSYIGAFYGHHAYLLNPIRVYDVLSDPTDIQLISSGTVGGYFEYMSFQDGYMFAGRIRPEPGATKIDVSDPVRHRFVRDIYGRRNLQENDDQFTVAIGNLLVMSDDQLSPATNRYAGTVIAVHDTQPDTTAPRVDTIVPRDGATNQPVSSRIGVSFTDNVELATVDTRSFIVRKIGGQALPGKWGVSMSVLNFDPDGDLEPGTEYEVVLPAGGIKDYVGNGIAEEFRSTFTTR
jgi:hypothetical protein